MKPIAQKTGKLRWVVPLLCGDERPKLTLGALCPTLNRLFCPPPPLLSTCHNDPCCFFFLCLLPSNLQQPRGCERRRVHPNLCRLHRLVRSYSRRSRAPNGWWHCMRLRWKPLTSGSSSSPCMGRSLWNDPICCRSRPVGCRFLLGLHVWSAFDATHAATLPR